MARKLKEIVVGNKIYISKESYHGRFYEEATIVEKTKKNLKAKLKDGRIVELIGGTKNEVELMGDYTSINFSNHHIIFGLDTMREELKEMKEYLIELTEKIQYVENFLEEKWRN